MFKFDHVSGVFGDLNGEYLGKVAAVYEKVLQ
jgi:hypothetical protein